MKKRCVFTVLAVVLLILLLPITVSAGAQKETAEAGAPMEITWRIVPKPGEDNTWFRQELEKKFNVKIIPKGDYSWDKMSVLLAAGDAPECFPAIPANSTAINLYKDGLIKTIPKNMIRKYMPNYSKRLDKDFPLGWLMDKNPDNENEYLTIQGISELTNCVFYFPCFRVDWAKKAGFELPNYEEKKIPLDKFGRCYFLDEDFTLDWLEQLLIAFRDGDFDGNGKNDTIPWGGTGEGWARDATWSAISGAFGINFRDNFLVNGELYDWPIAPGYKDFLKLAARWYKTGLFDREFVGMTPSKFWEKTDSGLIGACLASISYTGARMNRPPNSLVKDHELGTGAEVVLIPGPIGPTGLRGMPAWSSAGPLGVYKFYIGSSVSDEKLKKVMQIIDYMIYGDDEVWMQFQQGKPGVYFDWTGEPWKSAYIKKAEIPEGYPKTGGFGDSYPVAYFKSRISFMYPKNLADFMVSLHSPRFRSMEQRIYKHDFFGETNVDDVIRKYGDTLNTIVDEFYFKAITGEVDIDAEWDSYVSMWKKNGGDLKLTELKKAPIVTEMLKGKIVY